MAKHASDDAPIDAVADGMPAHDQHDRSAHLGGKHAAPARVGFRRFVGTAVLALAVAFAAGGLVLIRGVNPGSPDRAAAQAPATSSGPGKSPEPVAPDSTNEEVPRLSAQPAAATLTPSVGSLVPTFSGTPPSPMPQAGPGLTQPGILFLTSPASDGSFDVLERIRLGSPIDALTLQPAALGRAGQQFASASAAASQIQVTAGDQPVSVPDATITTPTTLPIANVDHFELRYRLTDVTIRSAPSTAGRALAAIGPLTLVADEDLPVLFIVSGGTVLGLSCPLLPLSQRSCGSRAGASLSVEHELPVRLAVTTVQFNLPPPDGARP